MKVNGPTQSAATAAPARAAGPAQGFTLAGASAAAAPSAATAASSVAGVAGMSALMALQGVEDAVERRRRAIRRGGGLLDRLDELKLALLSDQDGRPALDRLGRLLREARDPEADPALDSLLGQIDLRAQVELAKAENRA